MSNDGETLSTTSGHIRKVLAFWVDRLLLLVTGLVVCLVAEPATSRTAHFVAELLEPHHFLVKLWAVAVASATIWHVATLPGGFYIRQLRHWRRVPPIWGLALFGGLIYLAVTPTNPASNSFALNASETWASFAFVALCGPGLVSLLRWLAKSVNSGVSRSLDDKGVVPTIDARPAVLTDDEYRSWLERESPILEERYDFFDAAPVARRVSRLLVQSPPKNVGLVGQFGSGKSCVCNLASSFLMRPDVKESGDSAQPCSAVELPVICRVEGWGFREGSAALYVLKAMLDRLSREVACAGLAELPTEYATVLKEVPSGFGRLLSGWLSRPRNPASVLMEFDAILELIGVRFIVILEDLDRNTDQKILCDEIYPLLDRIGELRRVSFLFAVRDDGEDLASLVRIADHLEVLLGVGQADAARTLIQFRAWNMQRYPKDIDPIQEHLRARRLGPNEIIHNEPISSLAVLASNPRNLKACLRRTLITWDQLHGEIDCDDLEPLTKTKVWWRCNR